MVTQTFEHQVMVGTRSKIDALFPIVDFVAQLLQALAQVRRRGPTDTQPGKYEDRMTVTRRQRDSQRSHTGNVVSCRAKRFKNEKCC